MNRLDIRQILEQRGLQPNRALGQNFLHDARQLDRIIEAAALTTSDQVLEIGPGLGALTGLLLDRVAEVWAVEKDHGLAAWLQEQFGSRPEFRLIEADALRFLGALPRDWSGWKLVSNLPYSVASPVMVELALAALGPRMMTVTLQREVAERLMARPGPSDYGVLTLLVQLHYVPRGAFHIPPRCFYPAPAVESTCVTLVRRETPILDPALERTFVRIVKRGFSQRRKMMMKLLKADWPAADVTASFEDLGLDPKIRAERVSLEQFATLAERLEARKG